MQKKPSIAEIEEMMDNADGGTVILHPDGQATVEENETVKKLRAQLTKKEIHSAFYHGFHGIDYDACCSDTADAVEEGATYTKMIEKLRTQLEETEKDRDLQFELQMKANREVFQIEKQIQLMKQWIDDCQAGMYINCVYCGHRYGPDDEHAATIVDAGATPSMQDALRAHVEQCPEHPMSTLKTQNQRMKPVVDTAVAYRKNDHWRLRDKFLNEVRRYEKWKESQPDGKEG